VKLCSRMNKCSAWEYTMFAPAQHLHNWHEQQSSNKDDLDLTVAGEAGKFYYTGVDLLLISFLCHSTWLLLGCILNGTHTVLMAGCLPILFITLFTRQKK
jgi:hypothetical protein